MDLTPNNKTEVTMMREAKMCKRIQNHVRTV